MEASQLVQHALECAGFVTSPLVDVALRVQSVWRLPIGGRVFNLSGGCACSAHLVAARPACLPVWQLCVLPVWRLCVQPIWQLHFQPMWQLCVQPVWWLCVQPICGCVFSPFGSCVHAAFWWLWVHCMYVYLLCINASWVNWYWCFRADTLTSGVWKEPTELQEPELKCLAGSLPGTALRAVKHHYKIYV